MQKKCKEGHTLDMTMVVDSRTHNGIVRRRRRCRECGIRIYTEETIISEGTNPWSVKKVKKAQKPKPRKRVLKPRVKRRDSLSYIEPDVTDNMTDEELEAWIYNQ